MRPTTVALAALVVLLAPTTGQAEAPVARLNAEGLLRNLAGIPVDGTYYIEYSLVDPDGVVLWGPEAHPFTEVGGGVFHAVLGETLALPPSLFEEHGSVWLRVKVDQSEALPPIPILPVAYALQAAHAEAAADLQCSGCVGVDELGFDPATQAELDATAATLQSGVDALGDALDAHKGSGDHDARYVDVAGDTMIGDLALSGGFSCSGCLHSGDLADGAVGLADLAFDPATQAELDATAALLQSGVDADAAALEAHKASGDHDDRYLLDSGDIGGVGHAFCVGNCDGTGTYGCTRKEAADACKASGMRLCTLGELGAYAESGEASCCWGWTGDPAPDWSRTTGVIAYFMHDSTATGIAGGCGGDPGGLRIQSAGQSAKYAAHCCR